jgi:RND family efflux transporter MFP subunit
VISGARAQVVNAQAQLDRLLRGATQPQIDMVKAQIQQAETALYLAQIQVDKASVRSPIDGIVSRVNTAVGANVAPGAPVFELLSNDVKVVIAVEELRLAEVEVGQPVTIRVNAYPDRSFTGEVTIIAPELDPSTRTAQVTIRPTGDATGLAPGMFATVELDN